MLIFAIVIILSFLTLLQINVLPINFAFVAIFALYLFSRRDFSFWWLFVVALQLALFANLNFGLVLLAFTFTFLLLDIITRFVPDNSLAKGLLLLTALFLSEYSLLSLKARPSSKIRKSAKTM